VNLSQLTTFFARAGATQLYAKSLARNDNSKNQIYFAGAVETLNVFTGREIRATNTSKGPAFKAELDFHWLSDDGRACRAPWTQLILYPQYPEVRLSGFLRGCENGPGPLMIDRGRARNAPPELIRQLDGRVLFLGVTPNRRVLGYVAPGDSEVALEYNARSFAPAFVVFRKVPLPDMPDESSARNQLLAELGRINRLGWIDSKQLDSAGGERPCAAPQCGGFTLEAELRIAKNSSAEPDFLGWEVKQHAVTSFERENSGAPITLMTPEPNGGFYREQGVEAFIRRFGYPDKKGRADRFNFGGVHRVGELQAGTGMCMQLVGYDASTGKIVDANGAIALVASSGEVAAKWSFSGLLAHWARKHTRAVYVPSMKRIEPRWQYAYGGKVRLAQRTDALKLLSALATGSVYYDPGIKLERASSSPVTKRRSQFRIASRNIESLYESVETVEV